MQNLTQILQEISSVAIQNIERSIIDKATEESVKAAHEGDYDFTINYPELPNGVLEEEIRSKLLNKKLEVVASTDTSMVIAIKDSLLIEIADSANTHRAKSFIDLAEKTLMKEAALGNKYCDVYLGETHTKATPFISKLLKEKCFPVHEYGCSRGYYYYHFDWRN
jgi:hypothetical protein